MLASAGPDLDNGPRTDRSATMRMCAVSREVRPIDELVRSAIEALAMAAKASQVVSGFGKVEDALGQGQVKALLHASDGAADGIRKLDAIARQRGGNPGESPDFPILSALSSAELDLAL